MSTYKSQFIKRFTDLLDNLEGIGGPDHAEYIEIMEEIKLICANRTQIAKQIIEDELMREKFEEINKGDLIVIDSSDIFDLMGYPYVTGEAFLITPDKIHFKCDQTGRMEICQLFDGRIYKK